MSHADFIILTLQLGRCRANIMKKMKKKYVFVILINLCFLLQINQVFAQNWVWKTGSNVINQTGTYGTVGVSSTSNSPGARNGSITFTDNSGNLWLYGGRDNSGNLFNDLWKYTYSRVIMGSYRSIKDIVSISRIFKNFCDPIPK